MHGRWGQLHGAISDQRARSIRERSGKALWGGSLEGHTWSPCAQHSTWPDPEQALTGVSWMNEWFRWAPYRPSFPSDFPKPVPTPGPWCHLPEQSWEGRGGGRVAKEWQTEVHWELDILFFFCCFFGLVFVWRRGVAESRKKFYFYLEHSSQSDSVLILAVPFNFQDTKGTISFSFF